MARAVKDIISDMPRERRESIQARADVLDVRVTLQQLRKELGFTQTELAGLPRMSQASVSKQEGRQDMLLGTLLRMVRAMGGEVRITATIPGKGEFELVRSGDPSSSPSPDTKDERS
jgi:transcriptional regulator with XRE-family HTH domain